jgi:hypothetical protein
MGGSAAMRDHANGTDQGNVSRQFLNLFSVGTSMRPPDVR